MCFWNDEVDGACRLRNAVAVEPQLTELDRRRSSIIIRTARDTDYLDGRRQRSVSINILCCCTFLDCVSDFVCSSSMGRFSVC